MCGLTGLLHWQRHPDAALRVVRMADAIAHRGPDDEAYWSDADIALGFRRLSILDIAGGAQPMANEDCSVIVVFNGEIYNHRELRAVLAARGHCFKTDHSDTEVLVHGWEEWGEALPDRLNGMFAFAVWDQTKGSLFLARDRYGIKPLYLATLADGTVAFGSELRALLGSGLVEKRPSPAAIVEYFSFMNCWEGRTPFAGIRLLTPGSCETITRAGLRQRKYWDYSFPRQRRNSLACEAEAYRGLLIDVIRRQMDTDVPVMTYLSGGIDSTAVTAAAHHLDRAVRAYSCVFDLSGVGDDRIVDEREFSRAAAKHLGIDRVEMELPQNILTRSLDATVRALEYPRMGMAYVNYLIAERVAADAKVVLSGMGGDELTGGYIARYAMVRRGAAAPLGPGARLARWLRPGWEAEPLDPFALYRRALNVTIPAHELKSAFTPEFLAAAGDYSPLDQISDAIARAPSRDPWDVVMYVDATTYLHGLLVMEDKLSMAHSLETRVPLLDNVLVDYTLDLPWEQLADGANGKIAFREAVRPWVPEEIYAKPKMGFGPPDASWYRGALRGWIEEQLDKRRIAARGVLQPSFVRRKLDDHFAGRIDAVALIWTLLSFESWCRQFDMFGGETGLPGSAASFDRAAS
jgi:asparagine synthase (glutamine-hydrolysing)